MHIEMQVSNSLVILLWMYPAEILADVHKIMHKDVSCSFVCNTQTLQIA